MNYFLKNTKNIASRENFYQSNEENIREEAKDLSGSGDTDNEEYDGYDYHPHYDVSEGRYPMKSQKYYDKIFGVVAVIISVLITWGVLSLINQ